MLATRKNFDRLLAPFWEHRRNITDSETTGVNPWRGDRVVGVALAIPSLKHVVYFPIRHEVGKNLLDRQYYQITNLLSDPDRIWTGWNIKFDFEMYYQDGVPIPNHLEDIILACHHLNENDKPFKLKRWVTKYVDPEGALSEAALIKRLRQIARERGIKGLSEDELKQLIRYTHPAEAEPYACDDVRSTEKLRRMAIPNLKLWRTYKLWRESNDYLLETMQMEVRGMKLDVPLIHEYSKEAKRHWKRAEKKLFRMAGFEINTNSWKQLCKFLGTTSSAKEVLEQMNTPESEAIQTYRSWHKVDVDYYQKWLGCMDENEVLHPNLLLHGTGTGRQSAREPPLHGTPRYRKEYKVKDVIIPRDGYVIVSADYNQMELRIAASISKDDKMVKIYEEGKDLHAEVARALNIPDPDGEGRNTGKSINFMMQYGGGADKLMTMAKIPFETAELYIHRYRTTYWKLRYAAKYLDKLARKQGYIRLWTGRVRHFNHPIFADPKDAFNSAVQGGGAEMLRIAICRMGPQLRDLDAWILLQIHDQVLVEVPITRIRPALKIIRREMEAFKHWLVPPKVDFKIGPRWGQLEKLEAA